MTEGAYAVVRGFAELKRAMYRRGRPNAFMRLLNRLDVVMYGARRLSPRQCAVLKVSGRRSGAVTAVPVAVTAHRGGEFLVSMLGPDANWVHNARAAGGEAVLRRQGRASRPAIPSSSSVRPASRRSPSEFECVPPDREPRRLVS
ncbi:hypothetical protein ACIBG4_22870 [Nonomuraea sp. NPDC050383]|uniref:hypothetical protein n=1 Tax=Nonomuraea sp. NPDC050383 TaxID=3364362 RepID=UPI0037A0CDD0